MHIITARDMFATQPQRNLAYDKDSHKTKESQFKLLAAVIEYVTNTAQRKQQSDDVKAGKLDNG